MKKVALLVLGATLVASPVLATIVGSKHDLSSANPNRVGGGGNDSVALIGTSDETCVYCHTPHAADTSVTLAPLWNRDASAANATVVYAGVDLNHTPALAAINATDAPLCLSCHDGAGLTGALVNPPNGGGTNPVTNIVNQAAGVGPKRANLGTDMSNDHPIGFNFETVALADNGINDIATVEGKDAGMVGAFNYGASGKDMWCSSCHDVHDNADAPFLRMANTNSALCLACHSK